PCSAFLCASPSSHIATTHTYTLSLHDALPICAAIDAQRNAGCTVTTRNSFNTLSYFFSAAIKLMAKLCDQGSRAFFVRSFKCSTDRKSTRLNSSHQIISYAVFCLKKKNKKSSS